MKANSAPLIKTTRLVLRHFTPDDTRKIFAMSLESGMRAWLPDQVYANEQEARDVVGFLIKCYGDPGHPALGPYVLGVYLADSGELIGHVGLSPLDDDVEIGYAIEDKHQGKGFASEAVGAVASWALTHFPLPRILGIVASDNVASCKVLEKAGFDLVDASPGTLHGWSGVVRRYQVVSEGSASG